MRYGEERGRGIRRGDWRREDMDRDLRGDWERDRYQDLEGRREGHQSWNEGQGQMSWGPRQDERSAWEMRFGPIHSESYYGRPYESERYGYGQGYRQQWGQERQRPYYAQGYGQSYGQGYGQIHSSQGYGQGYGYDDDRGFFERLRDFFSNLGSETPMEQRRRGRGPKGWRRTDERIYEDVGDAIDRHGAVDASEVTVRVENGEVTLEGLVSSRRDKRIIEDIVEDVRGVNDVHNHLRVKREELTGTEKRVGEKARGREHVS